MLKKLSLAALVAMGSMSVASASTDLSDAIKGVSLSGFLRYRYTENQTTYDDKKNNNGAEATSTTSHEYKAVVKPTIKIDDKFSVHGAFILINTNKTNTGQADSTNNPFDVKAAYLQYKANGATVKAGQQYLITPLSDHDVSTANGVLATYTMSGVTAVGGYFDGITAGKGSTDGGVDTGFTNNLYVLAAIADIKPVKLQAWYYSLSDKEDSNANAGEGSHTYFLEAAANVGPAAVKAQYSAQTTANDGHDKKQKFWAVAATGKVDVASVTAAYLDFGKDGSDVKVHSQADGLIAAGDIAADLIQQGTFKDGYGAALVASAKISGVKVGVQYVHATSKVEDPDNNNNKVTNKYNEYDLDLSYAYNKKLNFSGYYAILKTNDATKADEDTTQNKIRFEAKYKF